MVLLFSSQIIYLLLITPFEAIMAIRVHALFERSRLCSAPFRKLSIYDMTFNSVILARAATVVLGSLYLIQGVAMMGMLVGYDRSFDGKLLFHFLNSAAKTLDHQVLLLNLSTHVDP